MPCCTAWHYRQRLQYARFRDPEAWYTLWVIKVKHAVNIAWVIVRGGGVMLPFSVSHKTSHTIRSPTSTASIRKCCKVKTMSSGSASVWQLILCEPSHCCQQCTATLSPLTSSYVAHHAATILIIMCGVLLNERPTKLCNATGELKAKVLAKTSYISFAGNSEAVRRLWLKSFSLDILIHIRWWNKKMFLCDISMKVQHVYI